MKPTFLAALAGAAALGGGVVYWLMREPETMQPAVDVAKIGTHALMPEHEGTAEDSWMDPAHREDHERVEQSLIFTESGLYTKADIEANGKLSPAEKFKGIATRHDFRPRPGDTICPITQTRANPKFTWVVGGKTYMFCCPPCIEEFVRLAKDEPDKILPLEKYKKK
jgi:YHS domain-containing protein